MEATQPTAQISSDSLSQQGEDNTLLWVALGIIAIYWYYKTTERKKEDYVGAIYEENNKVIDSYSKFIQTPLGSRFENTFLRKGVKPSINQVLRIDRILQGLSKYEHSIFKKAAQFERRMDVERALTQKEIAIYLPIRKKLMEVMDSILHKS